MSDPRGSASPSYVVGLVAAGISTVMVCTAVVVALVFTAKDDPDSTTAAETRSSRSSEPTDPPSEQMSGDGYRYDLPEDWTDQSTEIADQGGPDSIDTLSVWGEQIDGSAANVLVEIQTAAGQDDPEALKESWQANVTSGFDTDPDDIDGIEVDGERTVGIRIERKNKNDTDIVQIVHLALHDGNAYTIGLSTVPEREDAATRAFDQMIQSWSWE